VLAGEDDDAHALIAVGGQQPLAAHEPGLARGPADDVFTEVAGDQFGAGRVD
jgi:hypothetical protein